MTKRSDLPRLAASLGVLGTLLDHKGLTAWDNMEGWEFGPRKAPEVGVRGGGAGEAGAEDRKDEAIQRNRAAKHFREFRDDLECLDALVQSVMRRIDVAVPPPLTEGRTRAGDIAPETAADAAAAGWCKSCWRNDHQMVPTAPLERSGQHRYRDYCRWCGDFKGVHKIEPPVELLKLRHDGRRLSEEQVDRAVTAAKKAAKGSRKKKGSKAA